MHSIAQFLGYIALLESGVAGVIRAALYKPLADKNIQKISGILKATESFFRKICLIFVAYTAVLACVFPFLVDGDDSWVSTAVLVVIISVSTISQYYFGITNQVLLQADQRRYITETLGAATILLNAVLVLLCAKMGASLHVMKLVSSMVYALRPIALNIYVKKNYHLEKRVAPDNEALSQRWDGMGHHIAFFLHQNTDIVVLTVFSKISQAFSIAEVSVYSVYYSVVYGIEKIANILHLSVEAAFGNMIAKGEKSVFKQNFRIYEHISFIFNTFVFTCTAVLIVPFMSVYVDGVTDADYLRPAFGYFLTLAEALYCLRKPYNNVTLAAGHYRQTKKGAYFEAALNVVLSVILVIPFGITGVAVATAIAMGVRTFEYVLYLYKNLLAEKIFSFLKMLAVNGFSCAVTVFVSQLILPQKMTSYFMFFGYAAVVAVICAASVMVTNFVFYPKDLKNIFKTSLITIKRFLKK